MEFGGVQVFNLTRNTQKTPNIKTEIFGRAYGRPRELGMGANDEPLPRRTANITVFFTRLGSISKLARGDLIIFECISTC